MISSHTSSFVLFQEINKCDLVIEFDLAHNKRTCLACNQKIGQSEIITFSICIKAYYHSVRYDTYVNYSRNVKRSDVITDAT